MKRTGWFSLVVFIIVLAAGCSRQQDMTTLVLVDQSDPSSEMATHYLLPYLDHFGVAYEVADIHTRQLRKSPENYALVIIGHDLKTTAPAEKLIAKITSHGAGVVSFDPDWPSGESSSMPDSGTAGILTFNVHHYITGLHAEGDTVRCFSPFSLKKVSLEGMTPLVYEGGSPFLLVSGEGLPHHVTFASEDWMKTYYLGPLMGLDDCLWRSMVWAARKPFILRSLPPLVTMRVDDVAGRGEIWGKSPFYWVGTAVKYGFKPWVGLFIYNLDTTAVNEMRSYLLSGNVTEAPHAFGRPNRSGVKVLKVKNGAVIPGQDFYAGFYYNPAAMPLRETDYDEFIYFDHQKGVPWSDEEAERGLEAADKWYAGNQPFPMSKYLIPHWYEIGHNVISHVTGKWGIEYIAMNKDIDLPYADTVPWIKAGPFRLYEKPGTSTNNPAMRGKNPVYYADFVNIDGQRLFDCFTEIRDVAGYEWAPDNQVESSAERGITELRRALSGMDLAVLFTHETDYIYRINPENWDEQMKLVAEGIRDYHPMMMTSDDALRIVRAHKTSHLVNGTFYPAGGSMSVALSGNTDTTTYLYVFKEMNGRIEQKLVEIPEFTDHTVLSIPGTAAGQ